MWSYNCCRLVDSGNTDLRNAGIRQQRPSVSNSSMGQLHSKERIEMPPSLIFYVTNLPSRITLIKFQIYVNHSFGNYCVKMNIDDWGLVQERAMLNHIPSSVQLSGLYYDI